MVHLAFREHYQHAQPTPLWHVYLSEMHEFPHGLLFGLQCLQHPLSLVALLELAAGTA